MDRSVRVSGGGAAVGEGGGAATEGAAGAAGAAGAGGAVGLPVAVGAEALLGTAGLVTLDAMPSQAGGSGQADGSGRAGVADRASGVGLVAGPVPGVPDEAAQGAGAGASAGACAVRAGLRGLSGLRPWRLLPTPTGTPFTFGYAVVLLLTSLFAEYGDPSLISSLHQGSSTDVAHLADRPMFVLVASALWIAGGITSPYAIVFLLVLTALERRVGGLRTAGVFLLGHAVATLATEVPVGLSVLAGHLPSSSVYRLDYGISFGVAASVGALAGLLTSWLRWAVLAGFGWMLVQDLIAFTDPMTNWGHLLALVVGVATWPLLRGHGRGASA
ncbi:rhomboid-like protein [Streptomyces alboflavus]|uniref:rhomboid-like protein n=1 Tax=Streptomyces alboflavus TaxID=67267 RepID=UPI00368DF245